MRTGIPKFAYPKLYFTEHDSPVIGVAFSPDGKRVTSASYDGTILQWDLDSGETIATINIGYGCYRKRIIIPNNNLVTASIWDNYLRVLSLATGEVLVTLKGHTKWVGATAITPDGRWLASASDDGTVKVWDLNTKSDAARFTGRHDAAVKAVAITPDGRWLASGSSDGFIKVWDLIMGTQAIALLEVSAIKSIAISSYGKQLLTGSLDGTLGVWNLTMDSGVKMGYLKGHSSLVGTIAIAPDGILAVSGSRGCIVRVWSLFTNLEVATFEGHTDPINEVAISPDGQTCVSASEDGTVRVWDLDTEIKEAAIFHGVA